MMTGLDVLLADAARMKNMRVGLLSNALAQRDDDLAARRVGL